VTKQDANYWVNIDGELERKLDAAVAHVSQWEPSLSHYRPDWDGVVLEKLKRELRGRAPKKDGHFVEAFRVADGFNQQ
jgi:hypothetical protein